jgi:hypothetical protein
MQYAEIKAIAAAAWSQVKPAEDPEFDAISMHFRDQLVAQTEAVVKTRNATSDFEKAVLSILDGEVVTAGVVAQPKTRAGRPSKGTGVDRPAKTGRGH